MTRLQRQAQLQGRACRVARYLCRHPAPAGTPEADAVYERCRAATERIYAELRSPGRAKDKEDRP